MSAITQIREEAERGRWRVVRERLSNPSGMDSVTNVVNKSIETGAFLNAILPYMDVFFSAGRALELGAGQGWASCVLKRLFPQIDITATDVSPEALSGIKEWERAWNVSINPGLACSARFVPLESGSVDVIFAFAAAHHFADLAGVVFEVNRLLRSGGRCLFLYEPTTPGWLYPLAAWRARRKRDNEDVLVSRDMRMWAERFGMNCTIRKTPFIYNRTPLSTIYYALLRAIPALQYVLPCTATIELVKR